MSFSYPNSQENALTKVSFKIKAGEHVALLGRMGSGKTTIHKLILGLYQPIEGAILIDGIDARQIDERTVFRAKRHVLIGFSHNGGLAGNGIANDAEAVLGADDKCKEAIEIIEALLERLPEIHALVHSPSQISGGDF